MNASRTWTLCFYAHKQDNRPKRRELTEQDLVEYLTEHERTECHPCVGKHCKLKNQLAWSPVVIREGKTRANANVEAVSFAVFDLDGIAQAHLEGVCERIAGLKVILHSTHSYQPPHDCRVRLVFFLSRSLTPVEYRPFWDAVNARYGLGADSKARPASQLMFLPTAPTGAPTLGFFEEGRELDVDEILKGLKLEAAKQLGKPSMPAPVRTRTLGEVDMEALRVVLRGYRPHADDEKGPQKKQVVRNILDEAPLADEGARDDSVHLAAWVLARHLPADTPKEAILELMRASITSMSGPPPDVKFESWLEKAADSLDRASYAIAQDRAAKEEERIATLRLLRKKMGWAEAPVSTKASVPEAKPDETAKPETEEAKSARAVAEAEPVTKSESEDPEAWRKLLKMVFTKNGLEVAQIALNAGIVLEHSPEWKGVLGFNEVTKSVEVNGGPLTEPERKSDHLDVAISNWVQGNLGLNLQFNVVGAEMSWVAIKNSYDPLKDYLLGLRPKWDGVARIDTFLETYFCAKTLDEDIGDITDYIRMVSQRWLVGAVARGLAPGCKMDNVLVLEGLQGKKKSTALDVLGGEWFADTPIRLTDNNSRELASKTWIAELTELAAMRRVETESQKAFFSQRIDHFRLTYGRRVLPFPRRCVFVGSTNEDTYLHDTTGNRRYWPVYCVAIDIQALRRDRDQIWAEAVVRFMAANECKDCAPLWPDRCKAHRWWFDDEENERLEEITTKRLHGGIDSELVLKWWTRIAPVDRPEYVKFSDIAVSVFDVPKHLIGNYRTSIGCALKKMGFVKRRSSELGRPWVYCPSEEMKNLPQAMQKGWRPKVLEGGKEPETEPTPKDKKEKA